MICEFTRKCILSTMACLLNGVDTSFDVGH